MNYLTPNPLSKNSSASLTIETFFSPFSLRSNWIFNKAWCAFSDISIVAFAMW